LLNSSSNFATLAAIRRASSDYLGCTKILGRQRLNGSMPNLSHTLRATLLASLTLAAIAGAAFAGPFEDAAAAYKSQDYATAYRLYRSLADSGNVYAQGIIGIMYAKGEGVPQNDAEAVKWYRLAADQGNAEAQTNLGVKYARGQGVPQDYITAYMWFYLSAAQGDQDAFRDLGAAAQRMTTAQIAEAQKLAREWKPKKDESRPVGAH
jgi:TPR repeat protein